MTIIRVCVTDGTYILKIQYFTLFWHQRTWIFISKWRKLITCQTIVKNYFHVHKHHDKWLPRATSRSCSTSLWKQICHIAILGQVSTPRGKTKHCDFSCLLFIWLITFSIGFSFILLSAASCELIFKEGAFFPPRQNRPHKAAATVSQLLLKESLFNVNKISPTHNSAKSLQNNFYTTCVFLWKREGFKTHIYIWEEGLRYSLCTTF